jgi:hypothetical protein
LYEERGREYRSTDTVLMTGQGTHDSGWVPVGGGGLFSPQ